MNCLLNKLLIGYSKVPPYTGLVIYYIFNNMIEQLRMVNGKLHMKLLVGFNRLFKLPLNSHMNGFCIIKSFRRLFRPTDFQGAAHGAAYTVVHVAI